MKWGLRNNIQFWWLVKRQIIYIMKSVFWLATKIELVFIDQSLARQNYAYIKIPVHRRLFCAGARTAHAKESGFVLTLTACASSLIMWRHKIYNCRHVMRLRTMKSMQHVVSLPRPLFWHWDGGQCQAVWAAKLCSMTGWIFKTTGLCFGRAVALVVHWTTLVLVGLSLEFYSQLKIVCVTTNVA